MVHTRDWLPYGRRMTRAESELSALQPDLTNLISVLGNYLRPTPERRGRRAHQYTVNGFTRSLVQFEHFIAVPDPGGRRRADMLAGLLLSRPDDLIFLFDADPRPAPSGPSNRRSLHGIFRVTSEPFEDATRIVGPSGYAVLGRCPGCPSTTTRFPRGEANYAIPGCPDCGAQAPVSGEQVSGTAHYYPELTLPWRLTVEPVVRFPNGVSDERAYSDWEDPLTLWVGRHDNQSSGTGRGGKGSSIRQISTEEALKLARLIKSENDNWQVLPGTGAYSGSTAQLLRATTAVRSRIISQSAGRLEIDEFGVALAMAQQFDEAAGTLAAACGYSGDIANLEFVSVFYPWGYNGGTADFVLCFVDDVARYKLVIIEIKRGGITDGPRSGDGGAVLQLGLYVPWVVQRLMAQAATLPAQLVVTPVVAGSRLANFRGGVTALPNAYRDQFNFPDRPALHVQVEATRFVRYEVTASRTSAGVSRALAVDFVDETDTVTGWIDWTPDHGVASTELERHMARYGTWSAARTSAGLAP